MPHRTHEDQSVLAGAAASLAAGTATPSQISAAYAVVDQPFDGDRLPGENAIVDAAIESGALQESHLDDVFAATTAVTVPPRRNRRRHDLWTTVPDPVSGGTMRSLLDDRVEYLLIWLEDGPDDLRQGFKSVRGTAVRKGLIRNTGRTTGLQTSASALEERGVRWPMAGFSPGRATLLCTKCYLRHQAAEGSSHCLPCAVATAVDVGLRACDSQTKAFHRGHQTALDAVSRFVAAGAKNWAAVLVETPISKPTSPSASSRVTGPSDRRPVTDETKASLKAQAREAERRAGTPEGSAEVEDLIARTQAARERLAAERRAAETLEQDPDGGDAA